MKTRCLLFLPRLGVRGKDSSVNGILTCSQIFCLLYSRWIQVPPPHTGNRHGDDVQVESSPGKRRVIARGGGADSSDPFFDFRSPVFLCKSSFPETWSPLVFMATERLQVSHHLVLCLGRSKGVVHELHDAKLAHLLLPHVKWINIFMEVTFGNFS